MNRNVNQCLYCGEAIPQELQFTEEEIEKNETSYKEKIRKIEKEKQWKKLMESGGQGGDFGGGSGGFFGDGGGGGGGDC